MNTNLKVLEIEQSSTLPFNGPLIPLKSINFTKNNNNNLNLKTTIKNKRLNSLEDEEWLCETFIIKAASTRSILFSSIKPIDNNNYPTSSTKTTTTTKIDLNKSLIEIYSEQVKSLKRVGNPNMSTNELEKEELLFLAVNRYSRKNKLISIKDGLTLVLAHANGFHKEIWEPTLSELLKTESSSTLPISEIFALDCVNQGDSAILNEHTLGSTFSWVDNGRDILNFLISYIDSPDFSTSTTSSTELLLTPNLSQEHLLSLDKSPPELGSHDALRRRTESGRRIVGIGHSLGGAGISFAATALPSLFSSVILLDPVLPPTASEPNKDVEAKNTQKMTSGALIRRSEWLGGREEAKAGFLKKPFFRSWDERVLDRYIEFGLKDVSQGGVGLKCTPKSEALVFADPRAAGSKRAATRLTELTPLLPVHFILADVNKSVLDEPSIALLLRQVRHSTSVRLPGLGHLIAQESPVDTAQAIRNFLNKTYLVGKKVGKL